LSADYKNAQIPMRIIGPIRIISPELDTKVNVPLATFEQPLWPSVNRGARVSMLTKGIHATVIKDCMTRSILLQAPDAQYANEVVVSLEQRYNELAAVVKKSSKFAELQDWHAQIVGNLLFIRFALSTGDAAGHNIVTKAADELLNWIVAEYNKMQYISVSGNICVDKKVSAINGILGRGKYVVAELLVPETVCKQELKTTPEKIVDLNIKKNLVGSIVNGGVRSANAHFANMLLAFYLATGQDAANIVEGSQGISYAEMRGQDLYFSVTLPNIIVGTVGSGKDLPFVQENLAILGNPNARQLAIIAASTVLCGELSLLAAQTNQGELMRAHIKIERGK
jgi:hydroxymethylglutaryl-CoA reductase (NADPH)